MSVAPNPTENPLSGDEFSSLMNGLAVGMAPHIAVGVSGGADSMALVLLLDDWVKPLGGSVLGITVDHGLRNYSAAEASQVGAWLKDKAINHKIVRWQSDPAQTSALQARARNARYELMAEICVGHGIKHLFVAHNMEDQAETFLMRLRRKSGLDGLGAMAKERKLDCNNNITLVRPLLSVPKVRLKDTLKTRSQPWVEDPSNNNTQFERVRTRKLLSLL
ncbi:MAG: tRNA lysidine(34) synthetase TilS, partial [Rhodospirillaceae bacterium]|nr:tRNA lysidine(34) synthetase TilS [Rhodospirillaceae bacterium]